MTHITKLKMGQQGKSTDYSTQNGFDNGNFSLPGLENPADKFSTYILLFVNLFQSISQPLFS